MANRQQQNGQQRNGAPPKRKPLTEMMDRQPPFDLQAEAGVLGSIILMPSMFNEVHGILDERDFYDDANRGIFAHMAALAEKGKPIDDTLLVNSLKSGGDWEAIGGAAYLNKIFNAVPNAANVIYYAEIVREKAVFRAMIHAATELLRDAYDESYEAKELVHRGEVKFQNISDRNLGKEEPIKMGDSAKEVVSRIMNPEKYASVNRCNFGIATADENLGPMMPGELVVVAARPGQGKTAFGMQVLRHAAETGGVSLIVALEMGHHQLTTRELTRITRLDGRNLRRGQISDEAKQRLADAGSSLAGLPFYIWSPAAATFAEIRATIRKVVKKYGVTVAAIDYLSLIDIDKDDRRLPRQEQVAQHCRGLKRLAKELQIPLLLLQQLNREADDCQPSLRHLRESGAVEQDADTVLFLHSGKSGIRGVEDIPHWKRQLIVAKFRDGPRMELLMGWSGKRFEFGPIHVAATEAAEEAQKPEEKAEAKLEVQRAAF